MGKVYNNLIFQYLFILSLCIVLLIAQTSGLHMHVQHDDHLLAASGHMIDIHTLSTHHDEDAHHSGLHDGHHHIAIDIGQDYLVKKTSLLNHLALIVFFIGFFLTIPRLRCIYSRWRYKPTIFNLCYYFLQPPRAPPVN